MTGRGRPAQFLISAEPTVLTAVVELLRADPHVEVVTVVTTSRSAPERLVVTMAPAQAEALGAAFSRLLHVEPDDPLPPPCT